MCLEHLDRLNSEPIRRVVWLVGTHRTYKEQTAKGRPLLDLVLITTHLQHYLFFTMSQ